MNSEYITRDPKGNEICGYCRKPINDHLGLPICACCRKYIHKHCVPHCCQDVKIALQMELGRIK